MIDRGKKRQSKIQDQHTNSNDQSTWIYKFWQTCHSGKSFVCGSLLEILNLVWIELIASELEVLTGICADFRPNYSVCAFSKSETQKVCGW